MNGAKTFLGLMAGLWGFLTVAMLGLGTIDLLLPGAYSNAETLLRMSVCLVTGALGAILYYAARRLGPGKRLAWLAGAGSHLVTAVLLVCGAVWAINAPRPEGMLAVSGVVIGALACIPLAGYFLMLRPSVRRVSFARPRPSYPASAPAEEKTPGAHQP